MDDIQLAKIARNYQWLATEMVERRRRQWAAAKAREIGYGGNSLVPKATGMSRPTMMVGIRELDLPAGERAIGATRVRRSGGGRRRLTEDDPELLQALEVLIDLGTQGDPESPLRWTCKSTLKLADELTQQQHPVSARTVATLLHQAGYSLQANSKTREGCRHPDRNAQFEHINSKVKQFLSQGEPVISIDTKKKELVGDFKNDGPEWRAQGDPEKVRVLDFLDKKLGKAIPYRVYDLLNNQGWGNVGIDQDTAQFAANSIRRWWNELGRTRFLKAKRLLITADGGGSNSHRNRLWKKSLLELADELRIELVVRHFPPGTNKWNKIEHRLFSFITQNWRGKPLVNIETIVKLIASTTTSKGLTVKAAIETNRYPTKVKVRTAEIASLRLSLTTFMENGTRLSLQGIQSCKGYSCAGPRQTFPHDRASKIANKDKA